MQSQWQPHYAYNFWIGSKNLDRNKTFLDLDKDKTLERLNIKFLGDADESP
jgi:hypothetical protein